MKTKIKKNRRVLNVVCAALLCLGFLAFCSAAWYKNLYGDVGFDGILFTMLSDLNGVDTDLLNRYLWQAAVPTVLLCTVFNLVLFLKPKKEFFIKGSKVYPLSPFVSRIIAGALALILTVWAAFLVNLPQWAVAKLHRTTLYEDEFVDPATATITFPEEKRNLIYIFLESMETTYFSKDVGGGVENQLLPNLYNLAKENVNFSHLSDEVGGGRTPTATTWTVAAMVAQTAGIPLKLPAGIDDNSYGEYAAFLPGATSINDILKENSYRQALMVGSDAEFGGRYDYFSEHGVDEIYDIYTAYEDGIVPQDYWVWWGMEDSYLFEYAKQEITQLSEGDEPFAFTLLTVDTHFVDGYECADCTDEYEEQYDNVISCSDRQVYAFVEWIKAQPFYENTTVIISGDHLTMDDSYIQRTAGDEYERHVYNCILNPAVTAKNTQNRDFTTLDMFPTTLAAMGCTIENERLGLGTNLFSDRKTLTEEYGFDYVSDELAKISDYYSKNLLNAYEH